MSKIRFKAIQEPDNPPSGCFYIYVDALDGKLKLKDSSGNVYDLSSVSDDSTSGSVTFLGLVDTPTSYSGYGGKFVIVSLDESALSFSNFNENDIFKIKINELDSYPDYLSTKIDNVTIIVDENSKLSVKEGVFAVVDHNHDDRYYTKGNLITPGEAEVAWSNVINKPATYPPSAHTHGWSDIDMTGSRLSDIEDIPAPIGGKFLKRSDDNTYYEWVDIVTSSVADYRESTDPTIDVNPSYVGALWINTSSGEVFVCVDNTENQNKWVGQLGSLVISSVVVDINNLLDQDISDYQLKIDLSPFIEYVSSWSGICVVDSSNNVLPFGYELSTGEVVSNKSIWDSSNIWVRIPSLPAQQSTSIFITKKDVDYATNGHDIFLWYLDFLNGTLLMDDYSVYYDSTASYTIDNGLLNISITGAVNYWNTVFKIYPNDTYGNGIAFEAFKNSLSLVSGTGCLTQIIMEGLKDDGTTYGISYSSIYDTAGYIGKWLNDGTNKYTFDSDASYVTAPELMSLRYIDGAFYAFCDGVEKASIKNDFLLSDISLVLHNNVRATGDVGNFSFRFLRCRRIVSDESKITYNVRI